MKFFSILIFVFSFFQLSYAQEITPEQKLKRISNAERDFFRIPVDKTTLREELLPKAYAQRAVLAPNFPTQFTDENDRMIKVQEWIQNHDNEYQDYVLYLETTIRSFM